MDRPTSGLKDIKEFLRNQAYIFNTVSLFRTSFHHKGGEIGSCQLTMHCGIHVMLLVEFKALLVSGSVCTQN